MAGTVIEYLKKYGDIPFCEKPLNDVDSLALCQLSYLKFDGMVSDVRHNGPSVTLQEIAKRPDVEQLFGDVRFEKENRALFEGLLSGRRFRNMKLNEDGKTVAAMDCLVPGIGEIIGGSQREDNLEILEKRMEELGLNKEDYQFYLDLRRYGSARHAGFGLGFERCVMYITGMGNIRDVIPFPRTVNNCDL